MFTRGRKRFRLLKGCPPQWVQVSSARPCVVATNPGKGCIAYVMNSLILRSDELLHVHIRWMRRLSGAFFIAKSLKSDIRTIPVKNHPGLALVSNIVEG